MATLLDFMPKEVVVREDPLVRIRNLARDAGMLQLARDLEDETNLDRRISFRAGQPVWWFPSQEDRPAFMTRSQRMVAARIKSVNQDHGTVLIEHLDSTRSSRPFLVRPDELVRREIPGR